ncbi:hypothetical protein FU658_09885 [Alkalisalibacterium limincola]|uniref:Uncharacterized protein n=1 Tax=Alkalisalibacterium limincola TaxID=2699169 RepID=A0A5C8KPR7_9GAMM|nr:hypothetical protein FU658_09885 [Alkalisalibacterium limincola]
MFSLQYRWYDGFDAVHHAWAGWSLDADRDLRVGVQQVPFGLLPYASQGFWFGSGYYLGLEDDYDLGIVYRDERGDRSWHGGVMLRDEYGTGANYDRYSFDVATTDALPYREVEHAVVRYARRFERGDWALEWGASGLLGRIEDRTDGSTFRHAAAALHLEGARGPWTLQGQWAHYDYDVPGGRVALSAFMFPFEVAARADVLSVNVVRDFDMSGNWLDSLRCYNNLSTTRAGGPGLADSWLNVTGCSIGKGPMFTYFDWIAGRNMWFVGGPGIGISEPGGDTWRSRLNINVGFYF